MHPAGPAPRTRRRLAWGALAATLLAGPALAGPALAAPASVVLPSPSPSPVGSAELTRRAADQADQLAREQAQRDRAAATADSALEAFQVAQRASQEAARASRQQQAALEAAIVRTTEAKARLDRFLGALYRTGTGDRRVTMLSSLLQARTPQQLFSGLSAAQRVGGNQGDAMQALASAEQAQDVATAAAAASDLAARALAAQAGQAKVAADAAVAAARVRVAATTVALADTRAAAVVAKQREELRMRAELIARTRSGTPVGAIEGALVPRPDADCTGRSTAGYPNGQIPASQLCPLWGTNGQMLRQDAAAAFNAMSHAYAETFGAPICVTDSYRSYDEQVAVAAAKPGLAATPGSSNHGWGLAVDLCDGIQQFGSPTHRWMQENSLAYGFFHPSWAQQGGSKPEAWHWELAG